MNVETRLDALERRAAALRGRKSPAPVALIRYGDEREITVRGFAEGVTAALAGDVQQIDGDDADFCNLLRALSGTL